MIIAQNAQENLEAKEAAARKELAEAKINVKSARAAQSAANKRREREVAEAKSKAAANIATANAARAAANAAAKAAQAELNKKQNEFKKKEEKLTEQAEKANKIRNELQEQRNKIQKNKNLSNAEKNAELAKLRQNMETQQKVQQGVIQEIKNLSNKRQETIQELENQIGILTQNASKQKNNLQAMAGQLRMKNEAVKIKNAALTKKNQNIASKNEALTQKNREAAEALAQKNRELQTMTQTIANKNAQIQEALTRVRNAKERHETNRAAIAALEVESANLRRESANLKQNLTAAQELFKQAASERATSRWKRAIGNAASSKKINKLKNNTRALGKEIQNGKRKLNQTKETLAFAQNQIGNLAKAEHNARGRLKNTQGQLQTTQGQLQTTQGQLQTTQGKLQTTQGQLQAAQEAATLNQRRTQAQLNQARKSAKKFKAAARAPTVNTFNSTAAFQKMGNNLNQAERDKLIRKLEVKIDITSDNKSKYVINNPIPGPLGRLPGAERRALKKEIRTASLERLKEINLMINRRKKEINKNFQFGNHSKPAEPLASRVGVAQAMKQTRVNTTRGVNQGKSSMAQMVSKGNAKSQINKLQKIGGKTKIAYKREVNRGANPQNVVKRAKAVNSKAKMGRTLQALRAGNAKKGQR